MKKLLATLLIISAAAAVLGLMLPALLLPSPDIIGGAGLPSLRYYMRTLAGQACFLCMTLGAAGVVLWSISLLMHRGFALRAALLSLGASASAAAGLDCLLKFAGCFVMTHPSRHPIALPVSIIGGCIAAAMLWLFVSKLIIALKSAKSAKNLLICSVAFILHLLPFMCLFSFGYELAKAILK